MASGTKKLSLLAVVILLFATVPVSAGPEVGDLSAANGTIDVTSGTSKDFDPASNVTGDFNPRGVTASTPSYGSTKVNAQTGRITYTPDPGYVGSDSFTYNVSEEDWPDELDRKFVLPNSVLSAPTFSNISRRAYNSTSSIVFGPNGSSLPFPNNGVCTVYTLHVAMNLFIDGQGSNTVGQKANVSFDIDGVAGFDEVKTINAWSTPSQYTSTVHGISYNQLANFGSNTMKVELSGFVSNGFGSPEIRLTSQGASSRANSDSFIIRARPVYNSEPAGCIDTASGTVRVNVTAPAQVLAASTTSALGNLFSQPENVLRANDSTSEITGTEVSSGAISNDGIQSSANLDANNLVFGQFTSGSNSIAKPLLLTLAFYGTLFFLWFIGWGRRRYNNQR